MGQQQLLIIILGLFIVVIAIAVGIAQFSSTSLSSNRDGIVSDLRSLGSYAYGYKLRAVPFGGGGSYYTGFIIPARFSDNAHATYAASVSRAQIVFTAESRFGYGTVTAVLDSTGAFSSIQYDGEFQ